MLPIVERVQRVVGGTRMFRIFSEDRRRNGACLQGQVGMALARRNGRQQRQCVKRRRLVILWKLAPQLGETVGVGTIAGELVAVSDERFDRLEVSLLARGPRPSPPCVTRR